MEIRGGSVQRHATGRGGGVAVILTWNISLYPQNAENFRSFYMKLLVSGRNSMFDPVCLFLTACLFGLSFDHEDGESAFLQNAGKHLPNYEASGHRKIYASWLKL
jgi:hypothetical protein